MRRSSTSTRSCARSPRSGSVLRKSGSAWPSWTRGDTGRVRPQSRPGVTPAAYALVLPGAMINVTDGSLVTAAESSRSRPGRGGAGSERPWATIASRVRSPRRGTMSHIPVNHPLRPLYRVVAAITGIYILAFSVLGLVATLGEPMFDRDDVIVLGLRTNQAFAIASVIAGAVILLAAFVGRNVDTRVNLWAGPVFIVAGTAMLALLHTDLNLLNASVATAVTSYVIGLVLLTAGL